MLPPWCTGEQEEGTGVRVHEGLRQVEEWAYTEDLLQESHRLVWLRSITERGVHAGTEVGVVCYHNVSSLVITNLAVVDLL